MHKFKYISILWLNMVDKIKIDLVNRKILAELDRNCRISLTALGRKVGKSREAVAYRIQQLQRVGVIKQFITSINPHRLGSMMFKVYLKLENIPDEREKFFAELKGNKDMYWVGISDGAFDCVFAILAKDVVKYYEKMNALLSHWEHLIISKVLGTMVDTRQYNKKFFIKTLGKHVIFGGKVVENKVDDADLKILDILGNNARIPLLQLAHNVGSSIEVVRRRIQKLEDKGIILGYRIAVDFNTLGMEFFKAIIYFRSLSGKDEKDLFAWMEAHPNSLYYIRSLAPWEAELEFAVENYQQFNSIINDLRKRFPHVVRNYEHLIMIEETWLPAYRAK